MELHADGGRSSLLYCLWEKGHEPGRIFHWKREKGKTSPERERGEER